MHLRSVLFLSFLVAPALAYAVEFDCVKLPADPQQTPDCSDNPDGSFWCTCLKSGLTSNKAGEKSRIEQAIIDAAHQPTIGLQTIAVGGGTLDLSGIKVTDPLTEIGRVLIDVPVGGPENFVLDFRMQVTNVNADGSVDFDIVVLPTNPTTIGGVLGYDPADEAHSSGLIYQGHVKSFGPNGGFELTYQYLTPETLPVGSTSAALQHGDLDDPGFSVPILLTFPTLDIFTLGSASPLTVDTTIQQICAVIDATVCPEPVRPDSRTFSESFPIDSPPPTEKFRRGDGNGDGTVDLSDAVFSLAFGFLGGPAPGCMDAADTNDDGLVDVSDAVFSLSFQFTAGPQPPAPGPSQCGPDLQGDALPACVYNC